MIIKTFVYIGTSLDRFIARENGDIDWLVKFESSEIESSYKEFIKNIDAVVIGRGTFEKVITFPKWPYDKEVFVLSTSIKLVPSALRGKVKILSMKPKEILNYLSGRGFNNLYIDGGKVIQEFLKEDLIDELIITTVPVILGKGIPLFSFLANSIPLRHLQTEVFSNGLVKSSYQRIKNN